MQSCVCVQSFDIITMTLLHLWALALPQLLLSLHTASYFIAVSEFKGLLVVQGCRDTSHPSDMVF